MLYGKCMRGAESRGVVYALKKWWVSLTKKEHGSRSCMRIWGRIWSLLC